MTIYRALKLAGVPLDHHESDLYAKVTPESTRIVIDYLAGDSRNMVTTFKNQIDGEKWYDIPFAYDPHWEARKP